jgi:hypothetical protein
MRNIANIISSFSQITLDQMDNVKLMKRTDTKFAFHAKLLPELLNKLTPFYSVLDINGDFIHDYKSIYYDTDNRKFFLDHHNQRVNRYKIRFREYVGSKLTFLEIKCKNNKKQTIKKRIKVDKMSRDLSLDHKKFINNIIKEDIPVSSRQQIDFSRITLVSKHNKERLTIDINLSFKDKDLVGDMKQVIIAEVKQERISRKSDFMRITKEMSILPMRLSKYCMSTLLLNPFLKGNRFKEKVLFINKLKKA